MRKGSVRCGAEIERRGATFIYALVGLVCPGSGRGAGGKGNKIMRTQALRSELRVLRSRYDMGAVSPAIYAAIKQLEADIAWLEHKGTP
jgi:hypothetical protein